jgi:hypothetical protein
MSDSETPDFLAAWTTGLSWRWCFDGSLGGEIRVGGEGAVSVGTPDSELSELPELLARPFWRQCSDGSSEEIRLVGEGAVSAEISDSELSELPKLLARLSWR